MKNHSWRDALQDVIAQKNPNGQSAGNRDILIEAIQMFAEELREHGRTVLVDVRVDAIGLSVASGSGLEMELVINCGSETTLSIFSPGAIISNLRVTAWRDLNSEEISRFLVFLYAGTKGVGKRTEVLAPEGVGCK